MSGKLYVPPGYHDEPPAPMPRPRPRGPWCRDGHPLPYTGRDVIAVGDVLMCPMCDQRLPLSRAEAFPDEKLGAAGD